MSIIERVGEFLSPVIRIETIKTTEQIADERRALSRALRQKQLDLLNNTPSKNEISDTESRSRDLHERWIPQWREACHDYIPGTWYPTNLHPLREVVLFGKMRFPFNLIKNPPLPKFEYLKDLPQAS